MDDKRIIDLRPERPDDGELRYARVPRKRPSRLTSIAVGVCGVALGVALFLAFITVFVYVVLPLIAILIIWSFLKNSFKPR